MTAKLQTIAVKCSVCVAVWLHGTLGVSPSHAQSMHSVAALEQGAVLQEQYANSRVFFERTWAAGGFPDYSFGGSGVILDPWNVLISGHQVHYGSYDGRNDRLRIGTGSNYQTDRGDLVEVANVITHPTWRGQTGNSAWNGNIDLAILHLSTPIFDAPTLNITATTIGEYTVGVGYGRPGLGSGQYLDVDGQARAFEMRVDRYGNTGISQATTDYFYSTFWWPSHSTSRPLSGGGTPGNSGGGVFNADGDLVAILNGGLGTAPGYYYSTFNLRLDLHRDWIYGNLQVPAPGAAVLLGLGGLVATRRRRA
jgi:hypothetical protein